jgi:hypothetical protein
MREFEFVELSMREFEFVEYQEYEVIPVPESHRELSFSVSSDLNKNDDPKTE